MSLGSYATVPKAKRGTSLDHNSYKFLNAVHMDIAFGDCVSVGGYRYALILVDRATRYNWAFGLKTLSSDCILSALHLFGKGEIMQNPNIAPPMMIGMDPMLSPQRVVLIKLTPSY